MSYKKLSSIELRELQARVKALPDYAQEVFKALGSHIMAERDEIRRLRERILQLETPELLAAKTTFESISNQQTVVNRPRLVGKESDAFTENKQLFQAYKATVKPGSREEELMKKWSPSYNLNKKDLDASQQLIHNETHEHEEP